MAARNPYPEGKAKVRLGASPESRSRRLTAGDRLQLIFDDLEQDAPPPGEDGWDELEAMLNEGRSEGAELFRKRK